MYTVVAALHSVGEPKTYPVMSVSTFQFSIMCRVKWVEIGRSGIASHTRIPLVAYFQTRWPALQLNYISVATCTDDDEQRMQGCQHTC